MREKNGICTSLSSWKDLGTQQIPISEWKINYKTYRFDCADVDGDGTDDILLGVIKVTRFDTVKRKRIFIFKLVEGCIRPLWLGSKVSQPLEDFKVIKDGAKNVVRTIEVEENGNFLVAEYKWKGFGLTFIRYRGRNLNTNAANNLFNSSKTNHENV
jgi:hypothetical protein